MTVSLLPLPGEHPVSASSRDNAVFVPRQRVVVGGRGQECAGAGTVLMLRAGDLGSCALVALHGEIDASNSAWLAERLTTAVEAATHGVTVDLAGVGFCDASGIGVLIGALKRCRGRGLSLEVAGAHGRVARVFHLTGVDEVLCSRPGLGGALRAPVTEQGRPSPHPL